MTRDSAACRDRSKLVRYLQAAGGVTSTVRVLAPILVCATACSSALRPAVPLGPYAPHPAAERTSDHASRKAAGTSARPDVRDAQTTKALALTASGALGEAAVGRAAGTHHARGPALEALARAPLAFERQEEDPDTYVCRTPSYTLRLSPTGADIQLRRLSTGSATHAHAAARAAVVRTAQTDSSPQPASQPRSVRMRLLDANPEPHPAIADALPGTISYLVGNDPTLWRTGIATYARVRYDAVYPGIDIVYYGSQREIEYDFIVAPGASPDRIALGFDGIEALAVRDNGDLALTHEGEDLVLRAPRAYQTIDGKEIEVAARYRTTTINMGRKPAERDGAAPDETDPDGADPDGTDMLRHREPYTADLDGAGGDRVQRGGAAQGAHRVTLAVGAYDRTQPLVIDPILSYATALGGSAQDEGNAVAVDAAGHVYVAGFTQSVNFPASGTPGGHFDLFVTKLDPSGTVVLNSSFIGGSGADETRGLAIDADGNAYLSGVTRSTNFPTRNPLQAALSGDSDAFVVKIATNGSGLVFSTYLGGTSLDDGTGIAVDGARNVYVTGTTRSTDFPTASAIQATPVGQADAFVAKLSPDGTSLLYSTYLGGSASDNAHGLTADSGGNVTVVGATNSGNFPTASAFRTTNAGLFDAFVTRLSPSGAIIFSTYVGGGQNDAAQSVTLDSAGAPLITGSTASADFPIVNAAQGTHGGVLDAFVMGFPAAGGAPLFSTFLGGAGSDRGRAITRDAANRLYVAGQTFSQNFPAFNAAQATIGGNRDTFVAMFNPPYTAVAYATYIGGSNNDDGLGVAADKLGRAYVTGATMFAWPDLAGASDAFILRLSSALGAGTDTDGDGMPDDWESQYDLDPEHDDAAADTDGDGVSNLAEYQAGTHPLGFFTRYLAEGATGPFFDTQLALFNPGNTTAKVLLRFQREGQSEIAQLRSLQPHARLTIPVDTIVGLEETSFSTVAEADADVILDRTMTWDNTAFGSHAETAAAELSKTWYLAEGATHGRFDLYYLLQNPNATEAKVKIRYLRPAGAVPIELDYAVPPRGRVTVNVDNIEYPAPKQKPFAATDISAVITSDQPILAERAMYMTVSGRLFAAGHESMGVTAPSKSWFFAEGATGNFFDMYLLLANPGAEAAQVTIDYLFAGGGTLTKVVDVAPQSRRTLSVDWEADELRDAAFSMKIRSSVPVIAERAMWWPSANWQEAHNSAGALVTSSRWAVAEGELGGSRNIDTYVLIANTSAATGDVRVSVFLEDGQLLPPRVFSIAGNSRFNVDIRADFENAEGSKFAVLVEGLGATPPELVVERAMYSTSNRVVWAAGTNALGTPLFPADTVFVTETGVYPKKLVVADGTRIQFVNRDTVLHEIRSDVHPDNDDCPALNAIASLEPGQAKLTNNMVIELGINACGFHDERAGTTFNFTNTSYWGKVVIRP